MVYDLVKFIKPNEFPVKINKERRIWLIEFKNHKTGKMKILKYLTVGALIGAMLLGVVGCSGGKETSSDLTEIRMWTNKSHSQKVMK